MFRTVFVLSLFVFTVLAKHEVYEGHRLYNIKVKDVEQTRIVNELENNIPVDIWTYAAPGRDAEVRVAPEDREEFLHELETAGIEYSVVTENIRESLELEDAMMAAASTKATNRSTSIGLDFNTIHRYAVIDRYLVDLANHYPNLVRVVSGGRSFNGRDIKYLRISTTNFQDTRKPVVMLQSLLHAREWITLPVALYAIEKLVIDITERDLVNNIDWIILPIANPDGYEWTHTNARFWRKNRRTGLVAGNACLGVDLNRNFNAFWGSAGASASVCSDTFRGTSAFSEPETAVVRDIFRQHGNRVELFIDIHSHGSMILYGFGNGQLPPNGLALHVLGVNMAQAIEQVKWAHKPTYVVGNTVAILYLASGGASDWAQLDGATYSYTYELPSHRNQGGLNGFLVEPEFILQAGYETWEGIKVGARTAAANFYRRLAEKESLLR